MPIIAWVHHNAASPGSSELRRLGLPALFAEQYGWTSKFLSTVTAAPDGKVPDIVVLPASQIGLLPRIADQNVGAALIVDIDDEAIQQDSLLLENLIHLTSGRIDALVPRGALAAAWAADNVEADVAVMPVPDMAERDAELKAAALRFGIPFGKPSPIAVPERLWFAEPGDHVSNEEAAFVLRTAAEGPLTVVAPQSVLNWLEQAGLASSAACHVWSLGRMDQLLRPGVRVLLPVLDTSLRRHAKLARHGLKAVGTSPPAEVLAPFQPHAVAEDWAHLIQMHLKKPAAAGTGETPVLLVFIDLIQDLELALPIIDAVRAAGKLRLRVAVTSWLLEQLPRANEELEVRGIVPEVYDRQIIARGFALSLSHVSALLTMVETTLNAHKRAHLLTLRAQSMHIPTFTLQHGLENVGLTYADPSHGAVDIHSDHVFVWFPTDEVPSLVPERVRPRLIHVGRPRMTTHGEKRPLPITGRRVIAVFENLHWERYDAAFRDRFVADCFALARGLDDTVLVLRPHPAGQWASKARAEITDWPHNLILADAGAPEWACIPTPSLISSIDAVITTPSSVAVDAALQGARVGIAGYGLDLSLYAPLPILRNLEDWLSFASAPADPLQAARARVRFLARTTVSGASEDRIADAIASTIAKRLRSVVH